MKTGQGAGTQGLEHAKHSSVVRLSLFLAPTAALLERVHSVDETGKEEQGDNHLNQTLKTTPSVQYLAGDPPLMPAISTLGLNYVQQATIRALLHLVSEGQERLHIELHIEAFTHRFC